MGILRTAFLASVFAVTVWWIFSAEKFDPESVRGKRVIVTGSSMGIGEEIAYQYSKLGAKIIITARSENRLKTVAVRCKQLGAEQVEIVLADMAVEESRKQVVQAAKEKFGGLDILILNHVLIDEPSSDMPRFRKMLEVDFVSYVDVAYQALPLLEESNGYIGVVNSVAGKMPLRLYTLYSACKYALDGYFGSLRQDLMFKNKNVSISSAFLGAIGTEQVTDYLKSQNLDVNSIASTESTALAIIEGVAARVNDIYHPLSARFLAETQKICPMLAQKMFIFLYNFGGSLE